MPQPNNERITSTIKHITSSLRLDSERIKALFTFIPRKEDDPETIALAVESILTKYFKIITPIASLAKLKQGEAAKFTDDSIKSLPPRTINIIIKPNHSLLAVEGAAAIDGRDGYSELFYAWKKEAGVVDELGYIDLKRTNALSGVSRGDHLATIYTRTEGEPGITADGKKIKQRPGKPYKIKWNEDAIRKTDAPDDDTLFFLSAEKSGIVLATFLKIGDPATLSSIDIQETITINGDVDYAIGDQGTIDGRGPECNFSLDIKGNVRGAFSLQSNGFIHVNGTIEGKSIEAEEIVANLIAGRCCARAKNTLKAASIVNASARARLIYVSKNASSSKLQADEQIIFENGANCVALSMESQEVSGTNNNFSGQNTIILGAPLFETHKQIRKQIRRQEKDLAKYSHPNKEVALALLTDIARVEASAKKTKSNGQQQILTLISQLKDNFSKAIQSAGESIGDEMPGLCYHLQEMLAANNFHESVLVKVESLVNRIKRYNQTAAELKPVMASIKEANELFNKVDEQIRGGLKIHLTNPKMAGNTAELRVFCGNDEKFFTADMFDGKEFEIRYIIAAAEEDVSKGKIFLTEL